MKIFVIIPAFNEERTIGSVVESVRKELGKWAGDFRVLVVDDGSSDRTGELARKAGARVVTHRMNRGLGAALGTGLRLAKEGGAEVVVTFDGDGQHDPRDIKRVLEPILVGEADFVVGSRLLGKKGMPVDRKIINWGGNLLTWLLFGVWTTDSQSGLRVLGRRAIEGLHIRTDRMEVSSEFFAEISRLKLRYQEVPIEPIYTEYSRGKGQEGRGNLNAVRILGKLLLRLGR